MKKKYKEYGIKERAFVVVKADNLGSGAGLMTVRDAKDVAAAAVLVCSIGAAVVGALVFWPYF